MSHFSLCSALPWRLTGQLWVFWGFFCPCDSALKGHGIWVSDLRSVSFPCWCAGLQIVHFVQFLSSVSKKKYSIHGVLRVQREDACFDNPGSLKVQLWLCVCAFLLVLLLTRCLLITDKHQTALVYRWKAFSTESSTMKWCATHERTMKRASGSCIMTYIFIFKIVWSEAPVSQQLIIVKYKVIFSERY